MAACLDKGHEVVGAAGHAGTFRTFPPFEVSSKAANPSVYSKGYSSGTGTLAAGKMPELPAFEAKSV